MSVLLGKVKEVCALRELLLFMSSTRKLFNGCVIPVFRELVSGYRYLMQKEHGG